MNMENLNKQNYFTPEWVEKFPKASKLFCAWIDEYKKSVNWTTLFNELVHTPAPKFHDLPLEMQIGILSKFCFSNEVAQYNYWIASKPELNDIIESFDFYFDKIENRL